VWALSSPQTERRALSIELAEFLTEGDFLANWTAAAGYLPPRAAALSGWPEAAPTALVNTIVQSAQVIPPNDVLAVLGPALQQATVDAQSRGRTVCRRSGGRQERPGAGVKTSHLAYTLPLAEKRPA
jgi:ABC-type glycerol-3-phosphate transport system substrate-binding protein